MSVRWQRVGVAAMVAAAGVAAAWMGPAFGAGTDSEWKAPARAARKANPVPSDEKSIAAGKDVYGKQCLSCHGATGKGDGSAAKDLEKSPGDLSKATMWDQTDGALFWKITEGRKPMPSFDKSLSETERWQVVNYIRTLAPKPAGSQPAEK